MSTTTATGTSRAVLTFSERVKIYKVLKGICHPAEMDGQTVARYDHGWSDARVASFDKDFVPLRSPEGSATDEE
jgi:hypothetical protein